MLSPGAIVLAQRAATPPWCLPVSAVAQWLRPPQATAPVIRRSSVELRFHSPYRGWLKGLLTELAVFVVFMAAMAALVLVAFSVS